MGYSKGVYRHRAFVPPLPRPVASSSREITPDGSFVMDEETGGFAGMSDTMQRVVLLLSFRVDPLTGLSTDAARAQWRAEAFAALRVLTRAKPPVISDLKIVVESPSPGRTTVDINFVNNVTGDHEKRQL